MCATSPTSSPSRTPWRGQERGEGRLDFAVNNAGISGGDALSPFAEYDTERSTR